MPSTFLVKRQGSLAQVEPLGSGPFLLQFDLSPDINSGGDGQVSLMRALWATSAPGANSWSGDTTVGDYTSGGSNSLGVPSYLTHRVDVTAFVDPTKDNRLRIYNVGGSDVGYLRRLSLTNSARRVRWGQFPLGFDYAEGQTQGLGADGASSAGQFNNQTQTYPTASATYVEIYFPANSLAYPTRKFEDEVSTWDLFYQPNLQNFWVPDDVSSLTVELFGSDGGDYHWLGGYGGYQRVIIPVTPGELLRLRTGGRGASNGSSTGPGGFNGGGNGAGTGGGGGGGMSDLRRGGDALANQKAVAGGGGGGGASEYWAATLNQGKGGHGGGYEAQAGTNGVYSGSTGGGGGTQVAGGAAGTGGTSPVPSAGTRGQGGQGGGQGSSTYNGGGGGGGYYGGGGGGFGGPSGSTANASGGGGGSNFADTDATGTEHRRGIRHGHGQVIVSRSSTARNLRYDDFIQVNGIAGGDVFGSPYTVETISGSPTVATSSGTLGATGSGVARVHQQWSHTLAATSDISVSLDSLGTSPDGTGYYVTLYPRYVDANNFIRVQFDRTLAAEPWFVTIIERVAGVETTLLARTGGVSALALPQHFHAGVDYRGKVFARYRTSLWTTTPVTALTTLGYASFDLTGGGARIRELAIQPASV